MQEYAPLGITLVAIFASVLVNKVGLNSLRTVMLSSLDRTDHQMEGINARLLQVEGDLRQFYSITGELKGRTDAIEKRF